MEAVRQENTSSTTTRIFLQLSMSKSGFAIESRVRGRSGQTVVPRVAKEFASVAGVTGSTQESVTNQLASKSQQSRLQLHREMVMA